MSTITIGVDPGSRNTGIVTVYRDEPIHHAVLIRDGKDPMPGLAYCDEVCAEIDRQVALGLSATKATSWRLGIEGVKKPNPHVKRKPKPGEEEGESIINVEGLLGTAIVFGHIRAKYADHVVEIPPGRNGTMRSFWLYPEALRPATGDGKGHDSLRHARSAYDVALAAPWHASLARQNRRIQPTGPEVPAS